MFARPTQSSPVNRAAFSLALIALVLLGAGTEAFSQVLPNPYRIVDGWAQLPEGRIMGAVGDVTMDPDGNHVWAVIRCDETDFDRFGNECLDSESDDVQNPGWEMGIRIGDALTGWIDTFIFYPWGDPREVGGNGAEFIAVDRDGNLYAGEPRPRQLRKYVRVRP